MVLLSVLVATPSGAQAPRPDQASPADKETARALVAEGHERLEAGDYRGALAKFQGADDLMQVPTTGMLVAETQIRLGLLLEARDMLLRVERYPRVPEEPSAFTRDRDKAVELGRDVAERIPSLRVVVTGLPDGTEAQVRIDGAELRGSSVEQPRKVNPGPHEVTVSVDGKQVAKQTVTVVEKEVRVVEVAVDPDAVPAEEGPSVWSAVPPLAWVGFGFAAVGTITGTITGIVALTSANEAKSYCQPDDTCTPEAQDHIDRTTVTANISTASFIVGGVGLGVGLLALFLLAPEAEPPGVGAVSARIAVTPGGLGMAGTF